MEIVSETVQDIVGRIAKAFDGFTSAEIGSKEYAIKGAALEEGVVALARKHPRWLAEEETIAPWTVEYAVANHSEDDEGPEFSIGEYTEDLFQWWREMNAQRPSADSLMRGIPRFSRALASLCGVTNNMLS